MLHIGSLFARRGLFLHGQFQLSETVCCLRLARAKGTPSTVHHNDRSEFAALSWNLPTLSLGRALPVPRRNQRPCLDGSTSTLIPGLQTLESCSRSRGPHSGLSPGLCAGCVLGDSTRGRLHLIHSCLVLICPSPSSFLCIRPGNCWHLSWAMLSPSPSSRVQRIFL